MTTDSLIIRSAADYDLQGISELEKECFSSPWTLKSLSDFISLDYSRILVAYFNGELAGYVTYSIVLDEVQIANVAVTKRFRRLHIGSCLVEKLLDDGKTHNCSVAYLEVRKSNDSAIKLYEKCGFCNVGERKNFYSLPTENAVLMNFMFKS